MIKEISYKAGVGAGQIAGYSAVGILVEDIARHYWLSWMHEGVITGAFVVLAHTAKTALFAFLDIKKEKRENGNHENGKG